MEFGKNNSKNLMNKKLPKKIFDISLISLMIYFGSLSCMIYSSQKFSERINQ